MKQTEQPACKTCENLLMERRNCGRNNFYCKHPEARTEIMPHRRIAQSRADEIPTKTAPRWCPLKQRKEED